jgi:diacylglycerol kinase family enzyme
VRALLIHNPRAGAGDLSGDELVDTLESLGWKVRYSGPDLDDDVLRSRSDVVVAAGGDGTVGKLAKRLARTGVPIAVVPMGTANNIAAALGVDGDPRAALRALEGLVEADADLGRAAAGSDEHAFVEGFGIGVFASILARKAVEKHARLPQALATFADELAAFPVRPASIRIDGRDASGDYVMAAVMNTHRLGPALRVAPGARLDDGELDVVLVGPECRGALVEALRAAPPTGDVDLPPLDVRRAERVDLRAGEAHVDDRAHHLDADVAIRVDRKAARFLVPRRAPARAARLNDGRR